VTHRFPLEFKGLPLAKIMYLFREVKNIIYSKTGDFGKRDILSLLKINIDFIIILKINNILNLDSKKSGL